MKKRLKSGQSDGNLFTPAVHDACSCHGATARASKLAGASSPPLTCDSDSLRRKRNLRILGIVLALNVVTMIAEVGVGFWSSSVSLTVDGWHMLGHTVALGLTFAVMSLLLRARAQNEAGAAGGPGGAPGREPQSKSTTAWAAESAASSGAEGALLPKYIVLERRVGITNAAVLVILGMWTLFEAAREFVSPRVDEFGPAVAVAVVGLAVNLGGGYLLHESHDHENVAERGMYLHILSDALMSFLAIIALCVGAFAGITLADPAVGVLGGLVILKWGASLLVQGLKKT